MTHATPTQAATRTLAATRTQAASETIASLRFTHGADLSPDGEFVAWTLSRIDNGDEPIALMLTRVGNTEAKALITGGQVTDPQFSPDGNTIAYLHTPAKAQETHGDAGPNNESHDTQVCLIDLASGQQRTLTSFDQGVASGPQWSPDGRKIAFTVGPQAPDRSEPYRVTRAIGWLDGVGLVDDAINDIHVLDVATAHTIKLTNEDSLIATPLWHADSSRLTYIASMAPGDWLHEGRVRTVDLHGTVVENARLSEIFSIALSDDGIVGTSLGPSLCGDELHGELFIISDSDNGNGNGSSHTTVRSGDLDINGDVIGDVPIPFIDPAPLLLLHGNDALVRVQVKDRIEIHRVSLSGEISTAVEVKTAGCVYPISVRGNNLLYASGDRLTAPDFWVRNLTTGSDTRVTNTAEYNSQRLTTLRVEHLTPRAAGGPELQATFLAPAIDTATATATATDSATATDPLPTVLLIHGGPETAFGEALFLDAQLLCEAGFGVLLVNPRGSRGYGDDFLASIRGDWGGKDADDFMAAVDLAIELGLADPERLGVSGLSYGGYMTTWLIGHTDRFRAAVAENPVTNFVSLYGTSDIGLTFCPQLTGGSITESYDQYVASSPVTFAENVVTPTLLVISDQDRRCPPEQALQFYSRLRSTGCTAELVVLPGAFHGDATNASPVIRQAQNDALVEWMTRHLLTAKPTDTTLTGANE